MSAATNLSGLQPGIDGPPNLADLSPIRGWSEGVSMKLEDLR